MQTQNQETRLEQQPSVLSNNTLEAKLEASKQSSPLTSEEKVKRFWRKASSLSSFGLFAAGFYQGVTNEPFFIPGGEDATVADIVSMSLIPIHGISFYFKAASDPENYRADVLDEGMSLGLPIYSGLINVAGYFVGGLCSLPFR